MKQLAHAVTSVSARKKKKKEEEEKICFHPRSALTQSLAIAAFILHFRANYKRSSDI
jgi:hypothetical protein